MKTKHLLTGFVTMAVPLLLFGCAPHAVEDGAAGNGTSDAPVVSIEWSMNSDCSICHVSQGDSLEDASCLMSKHSSVECVTCHSDEGALQAVHDDAEAGPVEVKKLKKTEVGSDSCLTCHDSWQTLAQGSLACTVLVDSTGKVVNPHEVTTTYNVAGQHDDIVCTTCHVMHEEEDLTTSAQQACLSCHHSGVYECYTCHD